MIAEYRRILKNPTPERKKKCIFFDALHNIYQAKDSNGVRAALNNYEEEYNLDPIDFGNNDDNDSNNADGFIMNINNHDMNHANMDDIGSDEREEEVFSYAMSPSQALNGGHDVNGEVNGSQSHEDDDEAEDSFDDTVDYVNASTAAMTGSAGNPAKRVRSDSNYSLSDHQYQSNSSDNNHQSSKRLHHSLNGHNKGPSQPLKRSLHSRSQDHCQSTESREQDVYQSFDNSSCALLIDRMFAHLGKETEVMREWVHLERDRLSQEVQRRRQEKEREERREKVFLATLSQMQEQMFSYLEKVNLPVPSQPMMVHSSNGSPMLNNTEDDDHSDPANEAF